MAFILHQFLQNIKELNSIMWRSTCCMSPKLVKNRGNMNVWLEEKYDCHSAGSHGTHAWICKALLYWISQKSNKLFK